MSEEYTPMSEPPFPKPYHPSRGRFFVCADVVETRCGQECERCGGFKRPCEFSERSGKICRDCLGISKKRYEKRNRMKRSEKRLTAELNKHWGR